MMKPTRKIKTELLKKGGKKALKEYNKKFRVSPAEMNTGTRTHENARTKKPKYPEKWDTE